MNASTHVSSEAESVHPVTANAFILLFIMLIKFPSHVVFCLEVQCYNYIPYAAFVSCRHRIAFLLLVHNIGVLSGVLE